MVALQGSIDDALITLRELSSANLVSEYYYSTAPADNVI
jgi:hypothetical protein